MFRNNKWRVPYWRLVLMFAVMVSGFISIIGTGGGDGNGDGILIFEESETTFFEVAAGSRTELNIQGVNGEMTITGVSGADSVKITAKKIVQSKISAEDAIAHLQDIEVNSESLANEVRVETIQPNDTVERNYIVDYTIMLPSYFKIQVNSVNGIVTLDSIENDVTVNMVNANVTLLNIKGSALVGLANGAIESEVFLPLQGTIDLKVAIGDIHLAIPANTSATFSANALFGRIDVFNLVFQDLVQTANSLSGTLGSGEGNILLGTVGDISVRGF